jgi:hypothetical protein
VPLSTVHCAIVHCGLHAACCLLHAWLYGVYCRLHRECLQCKFSLVSIGGALHTVARLAGGR